MLLFGPQNRLQNGVFGVFLTECCFLDSGLFGVKGL